MSIELFDCREHSEIGPSSNGKYPGDYLEAASSHQDEARLAVKKLNLHRTPEQYNTDYYVGACWLKQREAALVVRPKIEDLDVFSMFRTCMMDPVVADRLNACRTGGIESDDEDVDSVPLYEFDPEDAWIPISEQYDRLTPLLILDFIFAVSRVVDHGLKSDYQKRVDHSLPRVRGRVLVNQTLKQHAKGRIERTACEYQNFTVDCFENRLLKRALLCISRSSVDSNSLGAGVKALLTRSLSSFEKVGTDLESVRKLKRQTKNPFFRDYDTAVRLARMVLNRLGWSLSKEEDGVSSVPPFYINMPLLFELYSYAKLRQTRRSSVTFQVKGFTGYADFVDADAQLIMDSKYKLHTRPEGDNRIDKEIVRQLSGYARDQKIRNEVGLNPNDTSIIECLILYPEPSMVTDKSNGNDFVHLEARKALDRYCSFSILPVPVPTRQNYPATNANKPLHAKGSVAI